MKTVLNLARLALAAASLCVTGAALAGEPADKAADDWARFGRSIDPNTFIVGHPASPRWVLAHANHEHPAVVQARLANPAAIDPNTFIVQPPATVTWLEASDVPGDRVAAR